MRKFIFLEGNQIIYGQDFSQWQGVECDATLNPTKWESVKQMEEYFREIIYEMMLQNEEYLIMRLDQWLDDWLNRRERCPNCGGENECEY